MSLEKNIEFRHDNKEGLDQTRQELEWLAREIRQNP